MVGWVGETASPCPPPRKSCIGGDTRMDFLTDLWGFMRVRKKYWLLPIIITLLFFGVLIVFTSGSAIAPFIYTIF